MSEAKPTAAEQAIIDQNAADAAAALAASAAATPLSMSAAEQDAAAVRANPPAPVPSRGAAGQPPAAGQQALKAPSIWDNLPESENYCKFTPSNSFTIQITIIDGEPRPVQSPFQKDKMVFEFEVVDLATPERTVKVWSVSSDVLMRQLSAFLPLDGKSLMVQRFGEGLGITYTLTPM